MKKNNNNKYILGIESNIIDYIGDYSIMEFKKIYKFQW